MPPRAKTGAQGPFDLVSRQAQDGVPFLSLPYSDVINSQILVNVTDNAIQCLSADAQTNVAYLMVLTELSIWGSVQGYETLLKRQAVRSNWGPMTLRLGDSDAYTNLVFKGRLFVGGKPGIPSDIVFNEGTRLKVEAVVHVQPREGLGVR